MLLNTYNSYFNRKYKKQYIWIFPAVSTISFTVTIWIISKILIILDENLNIPVLTTIANFIDNYIILIFILALLLSYSFMKLILPYAKEITYSPRKGIEAFVDDGKNRAIILGKDEEVSSYLFNGKSIFVYDTKNEGLVMIENPIVTKNPDGTKECFSANKKSYIAIPVKKVKKTRITSTSAPETPGNSRIMKD